MEFTTWERVQLLQCIPPQSKTITELRQNLRLAGMLELNEEEKQKIGWRQTGNQFAWGRGSELPVEHEWKIDFEDADYTHLVNLAKRRQGWPTQQETLPLVEKLGLE